MQGACSPRGSTLDIHGIYTCGPSETSSCRIASAISNHPGFVPHRICLELGRETPIAAYCAADFCDADEAPGSGWPARDFIHVGRVSSPRKSRLGWRPSYRASDHTPAPHHVLLANSAGCNQTALKDHAMICVRGWMDSVPQLHHSLKVQIGKR